MLYTPEDCVQSPELMKKKKKPDIVVQAYIPIIEEEVETFRSLSLPHLFGKSQAIQKSCLEKQGWDWSSDSGIESTVALL